MIASMRKAVRVRQATVVASVLLLTTGCASFRFYDEGRAGAAQEALELAQEIQTKDTSAFAAMRENIEAVASTRTKVQQKLNELRYEAFMSAAADMYAVDVLDELTSALEEHRRVEKELTSAAKRARAQVDAALERQATISSLVKAACPEESIACTIEAIDNRLDWFESNLQKLEKAIVNADKEDLIEPNAEGEHEIAVKLKKARELLDKPLEAPQVKAAQDLLVRAGQEVTLLEQSRLLEFRRHLSSVDRIQSEMQERAVAYIDDLMLPALAAVDVTQTAAEWEKRYEAPTADDIAIWTANVAVWQIGEENERTFAQYLEASLAQGASANLGRIATDLVQGLALILFVEQYEDEQAALDLASELHLHSINLSEINLAQNVDLVHQIAEALQIYYQGGIKPEEMAELIILSSQVAALFLIGAEV